MKYFNPSYWFKLWVLSAPLFNDKTQGINAKSIDNQNIKDWVSNNTSLESINEYSNFTNSTTNYQPYNLNETNQNINPFYQTELETSTHKHRHEKTRRIKKQVTPNPKPSKEILQLNKKLIINQNNRREYQTSFQTIINELVDRGVLRRIKDLNVLVNSDFVCEDNTILALNPESSYGYFRLPVEIRGEQNGQSFSRNLELVLRTDNLYVEGLMVNNNYYHFDFSNIDIRRQPAAVRDGSVPHLTRIDRTNNINLSNIRPDYIDLLPDELSHRIYWTDIYQAFLEISNIGSISLYDSIRYSLGRVILITAESLRFWSLHTHIIQEFITNSNDNYDGYILLQRNIENPIYNTLVNWNEESRTQSLVIDLLSTPDDRRPNPNGRIDNAWNILIDYGYLRKQDNKNVNFINLLAKILILPINQLTNILAHSNIRIILSYFIRQNLDNCNRRQARQVTNNNYWHEKFCDLKPQIDKIQGKITTIKVLDENTKGKNLKVGDIYVGTTEGVYLIHGKDFVFKVNNINDEINSISTLKNNKIFVTTKKEEIFYINTDHINILYPDSVYAEGLFDSKVKSSNLEKEIKLYYYYNKDNWYMNLEPNLSIQTNYENKILQLQKINPIDNYEKLEFLGDTFSDSWGVKTKWGSWIYDGNPKNHKSENTYDLKYFMKYKDHRNNKFHDIIENTKGDISKNKEQYLQSFRDWSGSAQIWIEQRFGLTWYWENENYYMKVFGLQYCNWWASYSSLECSIKFGNGIRLYNDDNRLETQISNPNDRKRREIFEEKNDLKNLTKWNNEFTKSINNEQHLPIDNKTNFASTNITSL